MSNEVVKASDWQAQIDLVKRMYAKGATDDEFKLMSHIAVKYELDPLVKQIWLVKYGTQPASIFTGRDGFLSIAHRTGKFAGMSTEVVKVDEKIEVVKSRKNFKGEKITNVVKREWQYKAVCTVRRKDTPHPFIVEVYEEEYTTAENLWQTKPRTMLGKVAESQCLRKAFDIAGLYSPEEMPEHDEKDITPQTDVQRAQAEFEAKNGIGQPVEKPPEPPKAPPPKPLTAEQSAKLARIKKMPEDVQQHFRTKGLKMPEIIKIMDDNMIEGCDDPEALRGWVAENPIDSRPAMVEQGEEGLPA